MAKRGTTLYLEDSEDDALLLKRALIESGYGGNLVILQDGEDGKDYLLGKGQFADRADYPLPDLIICDIKMPRVSGHEFVLWLRAQPEFQTVPVFMFSSSGMMRDMARAMEHGADRYFVKPISGERWAITAREMLQAALEAAPSAFAAPPPV